MKNKMIKNLLFIAALFLLAFTFTGCGSETIGDATSIQTLDEIQGDLDVAATNEVDNNALENQDIIQNESHNPQSTKLSNEQLANPPPPSGELTVHYIDVDQGDSTLLFGPDFTILIDAGRHDRNDVVPYLKSVGVTEIDLLIGTHAHADHIGQMDKVIKEFAVKEVWMSGNEHTSKTFENVLDSILESEAGYHEPRAGEVYNIGSLRVEVIHPKQLTGDLNDDSIALKITYGEISFLFTGDVEQSGEQQILSRGHNIQAQIFQLGHHGSSTSNTKAFLDAVNPEVAIYSAGINNTYGHPHKEVVQRIKDKGIELYGTDTDGTIKVITDGKTYQVKTDKTNTSSSTVTTPVTPSASTVSDKPKEEPKEAAASSGGCGPGQVDINSASEDELQKIKHIGSDRAKQIIDLRPFSSVDSMTRIKGIAAKRLEDIKSQGIACVD